MGRGLFQQVDDGGDGRWQMLVPASDGVGPDKDGIARAGVL
jgi:hypothetical protein